MAASSLPLSIVSELSLTHLLLLITTLTIVVYFLFSKKDNLPPSPWLQLPYIGYGLNVVYGTAYKGVPLYKFLMTFGQKYGQVASFHAVGMQFVVLNENTAIREAFQNINLSDRGENEMQIQMFSKTFDKWDDVSPFRTFILARFRQFGIGTSRFEESISKESAYLIDELASCNGQPVDLTWYITNAVTNIICKVIFGTRFEFSDERIRRLTSLIAKNTELSGSGGSEVYLPMDIPSKAKDEISKNLKEIIEFIRTIIESHSKNFDPNNLNDIIDMWLNELKLKESKDPTSFRNPDNIPRLIHLLFLAGTDTSATTLLFSAQYMIRYPEVQKRVQEEIDLVIGSNRLPRLADKPNLPFTEAVIAELNRCICLVPLAAFHIAGDTTFFRGYTIPKNSVLVSNLYGVMNDPDVWGDPENFRPDRFLDAEGKFHEPEELIPFGVGRRVCLGEALARQELFVFFTHLLHQFVFTKTSAEAPMPDLTPIDGSVLHPKSYKIRCIKRD